MNIFPFTRIPLTKPRLSVSSMAWLIAALLSAPAFAASPPPSADQAQSRSARRAEAEQMLRSSDAQYRESRAKAMAEYKAKRAECDKLQETKKTCVKEAKAARKQALKAANAAQSQSTQEAYLKAPELRPAVVLP